MEEAGCTGWGLIYINMCSKMREKQQDLQPSAGGRCRVAEDPPAFLTPEVGSASSSLVFSGRASQ